MSNYKEEMEDVYWASEDEMDPLVNAAFRGDVGEVARLLDAEPHLMDAIHSETDVTLLIVAAELGQVGVVRLLLERGAAVDFGDGDDTALQHAIRHRQEEVVSVLLSCGANCRRKGISGFTPLISASFSGSVAIVRQLLQYMGGRGLDDTNDYGGTAVWGACCKGRVEILRILLAAEADHTIADDDGTTPRRVAQDFRRRACVRVLQQWEEELERAYVLHRARCLSELSATSQAPAIVSTPHYLTAREGPPPTVEVASLAEGSGEDLGSEKEDEESGEAKGEKEKDATLKYVLQDLAPELYTELLEAFQR